MKSIYTPEQIKELKRERLQGGRGMVKILAHKYGMSKYMVTKYTRGVCRYKNRQVTLQLTEEDYQAYKELLGKGLSARSAIVTMGMEKGELDG